jgi:hypothetical protein
MSPAIKRRFLFIGLTCALMLLGAGQAGAQRDYEPLFDKFNIKLEGSFVAIRTEFRLDSEALGQGTTLSFEDDLNLDEYPIIPTLAFEWQIARRHRLGVRWQDIDRRSSSQALTEIQWGNETIPLDANLRLGFDVAQIYIDYAYYPWAREKWAAGFGLGVRWMELSASLAWRGETIDAEGSTDVKGTGPLPYLYFEYRRLFGDHWRLIAGGGWLEASIDDISGNQYVGRVGAEYLLGRHWGFGAALNLSTVGADWNAIDTDDDGSLLSAAVDLDINDFSIFVRGRF